MFNFSNKVVVVTGASRGIGRRIAERFYESGSIIAICSRNQEDIKQAAMEIGEEENCRIVGMAADCSKTADIRTFLQSVVDRYGRIDVLVNNAGVQFPQPSVDMSEDDWDATIDINLKGTFFASQFAAKDMMKRHASGVIINIGSVNGVIITIGQAAYAATKAAITQLTRSLGREWGKKGIRVNCVAPGSIPTAINASIYADIEAVRAMEQKLPLSRRGKTNEIADTVLFLSSDMASYITGQTLYVDGGLTLCHG